MFSRRHPYLFFILMFISVVSFVFISILCVVAFTIKSFNPSKSLASGCQKIGIIEVDGMILNSDSLVNSIKNFREEESIKAIVLRINSPGGEVGASQEIYKEIKKTVKEKSVIASLGSVAASGGYYIASCASEIVANPGTITGSIGVIMGYTNFEKFFKKIGFKPVVIKSGEYKDIGSPVREITEKERAFLEEFVKNIHLQFITAVAEGRSLDLPYVKKLADGKIYSGEEAKKLGLLDSLGNLEDAIELAGIKAGIKGKIEIVYAKKKKLSFLKYIIKTTLYEIATNFSGNNIYTGYLFRRE
mmetsp:Transcript_587/g.392  ORF Transcript_587/g.392 Transcript_587/m.392 type:complete len:302 (-) Transcript_587:807-1712(-)